MGAAEKASQSLLILADDLTGAADCAARCRHAGMTTTIALQPPSTSLPTNAVAFTSDSRYLSPTLAAQRVREAVGRLTHMTNVVWYKKVDSTLRGNLGSELDAMLDALGQPCAIICPAFPAQGRGLQQGHLVGALTPVRSAHLPTLLEQQSQRPVVAIRLEDIRAGVEHLAERLATARSHGAQLLVLDGLSDDDLGTILAASEQALPSALLCGSAGLIGSLAARLPRSASDLQGEAVMKEPAGTEPALAVVGSGSAMAHHQIEYMRRLGLAQTIEVGTGSAYPYNRAEDTLLHLAEPSLDVELDNAGARAFAARLVEAAVAGIEQLQPSLLVLVGGDTAIKVLESIGVQRLTVVRELLPGMPLTWGVDAAGRGIHVILKAGNHGDETTLAMLLQLARSKA